MFSLFVIRGKYSRDVSEYIRKLIVISRTSGLSSDNFLTPRRILPLLGRFPVSKHGRSANIVPPTRLVTKLQRDHYTEVKHGAIFELRCRCLIAFRCYRLAPSKYSVVSWKQGSSNARLWENNSSRLLETRVSSPSLLRSLLGRIPPSVRACATTRTVLEAEESERRIDENCLVSFTQRDLMRHKSAGFSHGSWSLTPQFFPYCSPAFWSILRSQVTCDLTSGETIQSSDIKNVYVRLVTECRRWRYQPNSASVAYYI